jgi:hypothetical protein
LYIFVNLSFVLYLSIMEPKKQIFFIQDTKKAG